MPTRGSVDRERDARGGRSRRRRRWVAACGAAAACAASLLPSAAAQPELPGLHHWCGADRRLRGAGPPDKGRRADAEQQFSVAPPACSGPQCACSLAGGEMDDLYSVDCDDPRVVAKCVSKAHIRILLDLHYHQNDDGTGAMLDDGAISRELAYMNLVFSETGVQFSSQGTPRSSTWHNSRLTLVDCTTSMVGNGNCDRQCYTHATGWDGGDCAYPPGLSQCNRSASDGACDMDCNLKEHSWDWGDCCLTADGVSSTCRDPSSPRRMYWELTEDWITAESNAAQPLRIHVYVVAFPTDRVPWFGSASFPHSRTAAFDRPGHGDGGFVGIMQNVPGNSNRLLTHALTHELGHVFGLYHPFRGESETKRFKVAFDGLLSSRDGVWQDAGDTEVGRSGLAADGPVYVMGPCSAVDFGKLSGSVAVITRCGYRFTWVPYSHPSNTRFAYPGCKCPNGEDEQTVSERIRMAALNGAVGVIVTETTPATRGDWLGMAPNEGTRAIPIRTMPHSLWVDVEQALAAGRSVTARVAAANCTHPCYEREGDETTGDFCADTGPTPLNFFCGHPGSGSDKRTCNGGAFDNTPVYNVMSYTGCASNGGPQKHFSTDQVRRIRCFSDRYFRTYDLNGNVSHLACTGVALPDPTASPAVSEPTTAPTVRWTGPTGTPSATPTDSPTAALRASGCRSSGSAAAVMAVLVLSVL